MNKYNLINKVAIITGGAQGFGLAITKRIIQSGGKVIIWDIDEKEAKKAIKEINSDIFGDQISFIPPSAGAMAFVKYNWDINSTLLVEKVREEASVMLVAGDWYGMDQYLRFGYGAKSTELEAALDRVTPILKTL